MAPASHGAGRRDRCASCGRRAFIPAERPIPSGGGRVLVRTENLAATLSGVPDPSLGQDPQRLLDTQVRLARTPPVALIAVNSLGIRMTARDFLQDAAADRRSECRHSHIFLNHGHTGIRCAPCERLCERVHAVPNDARPRASPSGACDGHRATRTPARSGERTGLGAILLDRQQQLESIQDLRSQSAVVVDPAVAAAKVDLDRASQPRSVSSEAFCSVSGSRLFATPVRNVPGLRRSWRDFSVYEYSAGFRLRPMRR